MTLLRRRLLLALGACVLALLLGEIFARIALPLLPDPPGSDWIDDEACGYRLRPVETGEVPEDHDSHINTLGFRDGNHAQRPEPGVPTETVLAGIPGGHGGNQAGWLETTGMGLHPDLLI